jgi:type I restriction enzyme S subunit
MTNLPKDGIGLLLHDKKYVHLPASSSEGQRTRVQKNDILISITAELGKIGFIENELGEAYVNQHVALVRLSSNEVNPKFVAYYLSETHQRNLWQRLNDSGAKAGLNLQTINKYPISLPPLKQQTAIADLLSAWDQVIEKTERLIVAKEKRYASLVSSLLSYDKYHRGYIRHFATEVSKRNNGVTIDRVLSVTNNRGFVLPEDQFERRVASSDLKNYKVVTRGQYAYNPSRINVGSIARLDNWGTGVLSPMYVVFKLNEQKANSDFFLHWLSSHEANERISKSAQGSVRETVSFADFGAIPFPLPLLDQQQTIATTLNTVREEIDLIKIMLEAYHKQKRGLMQKLLTGEWRVKIKEENAEWQKN